LSKYLARSTCSNFYFIPYGIKYVRMGLADSLADNNFGDKIFALSPYVLPCEHN